MTLPTVSIVVATCGRPDVLARTLERLSPSWQLTPREAFEIIVADDSADDATQRMVTQSFPQAIYVGSPGRGPATNRNRGAARAQGEWIAFIDDDCIPAANWLRTMLDEARNGAVDVIEGSIVALEEGDSLFRHPVENRTGNLFWTGNLCIRRDAFERLGRFDEDFLEPCFEDLEFAERIRRGRLRTRFLADAVVVHPCQVVSVRFLLKRAMRARWHLLYLHKTGQSVPASAPAPKALASLVWRRLRSIVSTTRRLHRLYPGRPRTAIVDLVTEWVTFPFILPYLMYWELRFRHLISAKPAAFPRP